MTNSPAGFAILFGLSVVLCGCPTSDDPVVLDDAGFEPLDTNNDDGDPDTDPTEDSTTTTGIDEVGPELPGGCQEDWECANQVEAAVCEAAKCDNEKCVVVAAEDGAPCDDGDACTETSCTNGVCLIQTELDCDDGEQCTADSCDSESGCKYINKFNTPCEDGDPCTAGDVCADGACLPGKPAIGCVLGSAAENPADSCLHLLEVIPDSEDGVYWVDADADGAHPPFEAYCDMTTLGGGWIRCGSIDEAAAGNNSLAVQESTTFLSPGSLTNASFCGLWYQTAKPTELIIHNTTPGDDYGEGEQLHVRWGNAPFTLYDYASQPLELCRNLTTGKTYDDCRYAAHGGWEDTSFSFTIDGLETGYAGSIDKRLVLGPTTTPTGDKHWFNFGAGDVPQNVANQWAAAANSGVIFLR